MSNFLNIDEANIIVQPDDTGSGVISTEKDAFVLRREISLKEAKAFFNEYLERSSEFFTRLFKLKPQAFGDWHGSDKFIPKENMCAPNMQMGFKKKAVGGNRLGYLNQEPILRAALELGLLKENQISVGSKRFGIKKGKGNIVQFSETWSDDERDAVISKVFEPNAVGLKAVLDKGISQNSFFDYPFIEELISSSDTGINFLNSLSEVFFVNAAEGLKRRDSAILGFCYFLAGKGVWFLPVVSRKTIGELFPRLIRPIWWSVFPPAKYKVLCEKVRNVDLSKEVEDSLPIHIFFLCQTSFYDSPEKINDWLMIESKNVGLNSLSRPGRLTMSFNIYFDHLLKVLGKSREDYYQVSYYYGGGGRIKSTGGTGFRWINDPSSASQIRASFKHGDVEVNLVDLLARFNGNIPEKINNWADYLEGVIPLLDGPNKIAQGFTNMTYLLMFFMTLNKCDVPDPSFENLKRFHLIPEIDGDWCFATFLKSSKSESVNTYRRALQITRDLWALAARRDGYFVKKSNPIIQSDLPTETDTRGGRTRRKSLTEGVLETLIEENRACNIDGEPFLFARSLKSNTRSHATEFYYDRVVYNSQTGEKETVFWPAMPIIMDMIFTTGMRSKSALFMDSGEGDETWVNITENIEYPNPLPLAERGCSDGFLRLVPIGPRKEVLGMFLKTNKTDPYEVPWVDLKTAEYFQYMRDWQIKYFPVNSRTSSIRAAREREIIAKANGDLFEGYFVFRDPLGNNMMPPTPGTLKTYWIKLLEHCEPIFNERKAQEYKEKGREWIWEPFLINGNPRWDIHSLRVTTVTTLIDAGVSPHIVAELVGHKSLAMTWHYVSVNNHITHYEIVQGMEKRRQAALDAIEDCKNDEDVDGVVASILGGHFHLRGDEYAGDDLLKECISSGVPRSYEVYSHGICPGGDCKKGGVQYAGKFQPVFRPQACSGCRFRVTGPAFLNGLVFRLNLLMAELIDSFEKEREINLEIEGLEDDGKSAIHIQASLEKHIELRENVWEEWASELQIIQLSQAVLSELDEGNALPVLTGVNEGELNASLVGKHSFELLQSLLNDAGIIYGSSVEIPAGLRLKRDEILLDIAASNGTIDYFYSLDKSARQRALNAFGDILIYHTNQFSGDTSDLLQSVIEGELPLNMNEIVTAIETQMTGRNSEILEQSRRLEPNG
ncbi:VPA1269 family protein [Terasakiella pusilla]|uniref:VPA1269 family protein n=1 Tax=Terasakiella pusilla TaxID=64973 RepID=UPI003AA7F2DE